MFISKPVGRFLFFACICLFITISQVSAGSNSFDFQNKETVLKAKFPETTNNLLNFFFEEEDVNEGEDEVLANCLDFANNQFFSFFSFQLKEVNPTNKYLELTFSVFKLPIFLLIQNLRI